VTDGDLIAAAALAFGVPLLLAAGHRPLTLAALDPCVSSRVREQPRAGRPRRPRAPRRCRGRGRPGLGNLLVVALLIAPAVAALRVAATLPAQLLAAAAIGAGSGAIGLVASDRLDVAPERRSR
jgi:ABC-type Mn2+/Zn2+ transport system permease subunit